MTKPLYLIVDTSDMNRGDLYQQEGKIQIENIDIYNRYKEDDYIDFYRNLEGVSKCELVGTDVCLHVRLKYTDLIKVFFGYSNYKVHTLENIAQICYS